MNQTKIKPLFVIFIFTLTWLMGFTPGLTAQEIPNNSFENLDKNGFPMNWYMEEPGTKDYISASIDPKEAHADQKSLCIRHHRWDRSTVISEPVILKVGHLYRLSGWIKTEAAQSRPTDRYPTSAAACLTMESFPFTNHSPSAAATTGWKKIETLFIASKSKDHVRLHLGMNGDAVGKAWFDDIRLEKVEDITAYIPMETVKWFGPAFRYTDKGWIFVHIEGKAYERGYQYGYLLSMEIVEYMKKLAVRTNEKDIIDGWNQLRRTTDAFFLRKYDPEYLEEMKGIADGAVKAGAAFEGVPLDLIDIVAINTAIDIGQVDGGMRYTPHALTGKSFLNAEDELNIPGRQHKCSGFLANGPASKDGRIVFGQLFMWSGYTGVHFNVICDVLPDKGHRFVYETFPGGIHSGTDFYINSAGIMIGETTVNQTPFNMNGLTQSSRIRKAIHYASGIDDVVRILSTENNGLYTNDWLIADTKTDETAIFLLGTKKNKLWRSKTGDFPGGTQGFYWSVNNAKEIEVRKEYIANKDNAPYDFIFTPWNRDLAFNEFYKKYNGRFDSITGVNMLASSPINRPHACDGKITTSEMAEQLMFLAHFGKVTLREKFPTPNSRIMPDLPDAIPHLTLGYSVISPIFVTEKLKALKNSQEKAPETKKTPEPDISAVKDFYTFSPRALWFNTVYPSSEKENWFVSATAAYWAMLKALPPSAPQAVTTFKNGLNDLTLRLLYITSREGSIAPLNARRVYDAYNNYQVPRIRGTFLLHQLRLLLGADPFSKIMNEIHNTFKDKPVTNKQIVDTASRIAQKNLEPFFMQWLNRSDLPIIKPTPQLKKNGEQWQIDLQVHQDGQPYHFIAFVEIETEKSKKWEKIEVSQPDQVFTFSYPDKPVSLVFNAGRDIPVQQPDYYVFTNFADDFRDTIIIYGTSRQVEANHTLALRFRDVMADLTAEILSPVKKDSEVDETELAQHDLMVLGGPEDNSLTRTLADKLGLSLGKNYFQWQDKTYGDAEDGLIVVYPNPYNPKRVLYLVIANSALQLYRMTRVYPLIPNWAVFKKEQAVERGYHPVKDFVFRF